MARYDRIARLDLPGRDEAFTGWLVLGDLAGRGRDPDLGRRARLRFLAVRLIHRLVRSGETVDFNSLQQQCDAVREELRQLPDQDQERQRLTELLTGVTTLSAPTIVRATLELGRGARAAGHYFGAEECYRVAAALAGDRGLQALRAEAGRELDALNGERSRQDDG